MPLTVRLDPRTERALNALAKRRGVSRSDIVRDALAQYGAGEAAAETGNEVFGAWQDVLGVVSLGARRADATTGEQFSAIVRNAARARRAR